MSESPITVDWIVAQVARIREVRWDSEVAHGYEDDLYATVLQGIADGSCADPQGCATAALMTEAIDFDRWYA